MKRSLIFGLIIAISFVLAFTAPSTNAQGPQLGTDKPAAQAPAKAPAAKKAEAKPVPTKVDDPLALTQLQLTITKRKLAEAQYNNVINQAKQLQTDFETLTNQFNSQVDSLYAQLGIKREDFDINLETGDITPLKKQQ